VSHPSNSREIKPEVAGYGNAEVWHVRKRNRVISTGDVDIQHSCSLKKCLKCCLPSLKGTSSAIVDDSVLEDRA
jgi:hypothetical protein